MRFATVIVILIGLIPGASFGQARPAVGKGSALGAVRPSDPGADPEWLRTRLEKVRRRHDLPDLGAAIVIEDRVVAASVVGVRKYGTNIAATRDDPFHLGSITKVMSAALIATFVDEGLLRWDTTMEEMYPELLRMMQPGYRKVTVLQLLSHTSGLPAATSATIQQVTARGRDPVQRRYEWVKAAVIDPPAAPPGTRTIYTGGAVYVIAYIERKTRKSYEQLMQERLFRPLGMTTAGISDHMASEGKIDAPWGHRQSNGQTEPVPPDRHSPVNGLQPVGGGYCSIADLGKFLAWHLDGARGRARLLRPETFGVLQAAAPGGHFAPGWAVEYGGWGEGKTLAHNGSTGIYLATCGIAVDEGYGLCVGTNAAGEPRADEALGEVLRYLTLRVNHGPRRRLLREVPAWKPPVPPKPDVYLDELVPLRATVGFASFHVGQSADGTPLKLDGDVYAHGLGVHAPSEVSYEVKAEYRRFVARVGPEERNWRGSVVAQVYFDNTLVEQSPWMKAGDPPWNINIAIPPRPSRKAPRRIHLVLTEGGDGRHSDWGEWVDAGFVTRRE